LASAFPPTPPPPPPIYTLSLHDALPISFGGERFQALRCDGVFHTQGTDGRPAQGREIAATSEPLAQIACDGANVGTRAAAARKRSEEHTSELQSRFDLVCRLLLEKKKNR